MSTAASSLLEKAGDFLKVGDYLHSMEHEMRTEGPTAPIDMALHSKMQEYIKTRQQIGQKMDKPIDDLWKGIRNDNLGHDYSKDSLASIHSTLTTRNHPAQASSGVLMGNPANHGKTLLDIKNSVAPEANLAAQAQVFGKQKEYILPLFYELYKSPNPADHTHADALANIFSSVLHDKTYVKGFVSDTKLKIQNFTKKMNKLQSSIGGPQAAVIGNKEVGKYIYEPPSSRERNISRWLRTLSAPFMAIPHIGTAFNLASTPISMIAKGVMSLPDKHFRQLIETTGVLASTMHSIMDNDLRFRTGVTSKFVGSRAANLIQASLHNPGFHQVRLSQLMFGGAVGYHAAIDWAEMLGRGSKRAEAEIREMGLDPAAIKARGGKLTDPELKQAIFHYVNNRFFIDKPMSRPLMSNANKWLRTATMFHAFVSYQSKFMRTETMKMIKTGDFVSLAQYAGTIGILFPTVAPMIKSAEMLLRTGSPDEARKSAEQDYQTLSHPAVDRHFLFTYIDMLSYLGAYGVYSHFLQAADAHRLANQMAGPLFGAAATMGEDVEQPVSAMIKGKKSNFAPLGRDALRYGIPVFGGSLSHQLLPKKPTGSRGRGRRRF